MLSSSGRGSPSSAEKPSCVSGVRSFVARLGIEFLLQSLDFFTEALNRGILLLQVLDALVQSAVLLTQGFCVGFLLGVQLLGDGAFRDGGLAELNFEPSPGVL
jgi:hypothetical protein